METVNYGYNLFGEVVVLVVLRIRVGSCMESLLVYGGVLKLGVATPSPLVVLGEGGLSAVLYKTSRLRLPFLPSTSGRGAGGEGGR